MLCTLQVCCTKPTGCFVGLVVSWLDPRILGAILDEKKEGKENARRTPVGSEVVSAWELSQSPYKVYGCALDHQSPECLMVSQFRQRFSHIRHVSKTNLDVCSQETETNQIEQASNNWINRSKLWSCLRRLESLDGSLTGACVSACCSSLAARWGNSGAKGPEWLAMRMARWARWWFYQIMEEEKNVFWIKLRMERKIKRKREESLDSRSSDCVFPGTNPHVLLMCYVPIFHHRSH